MVGTFNLELNTLNATIYSVQGLDIKSYLHIAAYTIVQLLLFTLCWSEEININLSNRITGFVRRHTCSFASGFSNVHEFRERECFNFKAIIWIIISFVSVVQKRSIRHTKSIPMQISVMRKLIWQLHIHKVCLALY